MRGSARRDRAYYQQLRARRHTVTKQPYGSSPTDWVGILHGCLKTGTTYDEHTAWAHILQRAA